MLPYFPIESDDFVMSMARALPVDSLIEVDLACYREELALKDAILAEDYRYYFQAPLETEPMAWESIELLLPNMVRYHPQHFGLRRDGDRWEWENRILGTTTVFTFGDAATLPLPPLDWLGRQMQEDLLLMAEDAERGTPLVAGHLCFASGWSLDEKMGQSFLTIHEPVPHFAEKIGRPADLLMQRLKVDHPTGRVGWALTTDVGLNHAPCLAHQWRQSWHGVTAENAGERCYLRLERQTFSRLPRTRAVLFTIHTYRAPIARVLATSDGADRARRLAGSIRTMPTALQGYKKLAPYREELLAYLEGRARG
ncbi:MAG: DUF3445 domain-containing protein [Chloroflexia bacterium]